MQIRVLTYNIHKCIGGLDRRYRPERVRETIGHHAPDVVLMQEVDDMAARSAWDRQVDVLGDELGLAHRAFFPNVRVRGGGHYGNAVLSRFPITQATNLDLTKGWRKPRSVLHARLRVRVGGRTRTVHVFNLHLGLAESERRWQIERFFDSHPFSRLHPRTPIIVGGDFNAASLRSLRSFDSPLQSVGFERVTDESMKSFRRFGRDFALDHLYVRDLAASSVGVELESTASDHQAVWAELEVKPSNPSA